MLKRLGFALKVKLSLLNPYAIPPNFKHLPTATVAKLLEVKQVNSHSYILRYTLPDMRRCLGISIGEYVNINYDNEKRSYVPISRIDEAGICDFFIRDTSLEVGVKRSFAKKLIDMPIGTEVELTGPYNQFRYEGYGKLTYDFQDGQTITKQFRNICIVAYGSSITATYTLIDSILHFGDDRTGVSLIWVCKKMEDFVFLEEFNNLVEENKLNMTLMLEEFNSQFPGDYGDLMESHIISAFPSPKGTAVIVCGTDPTHTTKLSALLDKIGYEHVVALK